MNVTVPGSSLYFLLGCFQDIIGDAQILKNYFAFQVLQLANGNDNMTYVRINCHIDLYVVEPSQLC